MAKNSRSIQERIKSRIIKDWKKISYKIISIIAKKPLQIIYEKHNGRQLIHEITPKETLMITETTDGVIFVSSSSDEIIGKSIFVTRESFDADHIIKSFEILGVKKIRTLLDVGANIGSIGLFALKNNYAERCIAFEPEPLNFHLLQTNVMLNRVSDRFELHNVALGAGEAGEVIFELSDDNHGDHRVRATDDKGKDGEELRKTIRVRSSTLESIIRPDDLRDCLLFMDTQGFEGHILEGSKSLINAGVPIVTEFWPYGLQRAKGLEKFIRAVTNGPYTTVFDLCQPTTPTPISEANIRRIIERYSDPKKFTDLVIFWLLHGSCG